MHGCLAGKNQEALDEVWWVRIEREREYFSMRRLGAFGSEVACLSAFFDPPWERLASGLSEEGKAVVLPNTGSALRALGRLPEATALMRMGIARYVVQEDWNNAAAATSNLSEILQVGGGLREALDQARKSVELADRSGNTFRRRTNTATLAAVLHAMGRREDAAALLEEAERMQNDDPREYPQLYSLAGFQYCDLLLDQCRDADVRERAAQTLSSGSGWYSLISIALDRLSLGRAHFLASQRGAAVDLTQAASHLTAAVDGLRRASQQDFLPLGLLARAALHTHTRDFPLARKDLDEALTLATRCGFRLHECDAHLGLARLALAEGDPATARPHIERARKLIHDTGYHRRDEELAALDADAG